MNVKLKTNDTSISKSNISLITPISPLIETNQSPLDLIQKERDLDAEINQFGNKKDTLLKATNYINNHESEKVYQLINKWKDISQQASNYLLNDSQVKIERMGGLSKFEAKRKEKMKSSFFDEENEDGQGIEEKYQEFIKSDQFFELSESERKEIQSKFDFLSNKNNSDVDEQSESSTLQMHQLYEYLNLDYNLVYGD